MNKNTQIIKELQKIIGDEYDVKEVTVQKVNMQKKVGIHCVKHGEDVGPVFYPDDYKDESPKKIAELVANELERENKTISEMKEKLNPDYVKEHLYIRLVADDINDMDALRDKYCITETGLPHLYAMFACDMDTNYRFMITNEYAELSGFTPEELYRIALEKLNAKRLVLTSLAAFLLGEESDMDNYSTVLIMNPGEDFAASSILADNAFDMVYKIMKSNYYLIPSSVHEWLFIRDTEDISFVDMRCMVKEVNDSAVSERDRLSYMIWYYNGKELVCFD